MSGTILAVVAVVFLAIFVLAASAVFLCFALAMLEDLPDDSPIRELFHRFLSKGKEKW